MLHNFSLMVNVSKAEAAVQADRERELAIIGTANVARLNKVVAAALIAATAIGIMSEV